VNYPPMLQNLRNIGIIAHIDAGKTTTTERILYYTGLTHKIGETHDGESVMDFLAWEKERGITVASAATRCNWNGYEINIIDTPGHIDFTAEVERSLRVLDGAVVIFCGRGGVEPQSETVWRQADKYRIPRIAYINKMDAVGADFFKVVDQIKKQLGAQPLVLQLPVYEDENYVGLIDLVNMRCLYFTGQHGSKIHEGAIPPAYRQAANTWHQAMLEKLAEENDEILELYLAEETVPARLLQKAIRENTLNNNLVPVLCGSSYRNIGVQPLLDAVTGYLPSPQDVGLVRAKLEANDEIIEIEPDVNDDFCALIFKIISDRHVGKLAFARVYSGTVKSGCFIYNASQGKKERIGRLLKVHANHREEVNQVQAGDIVAIIGLKHSQTGDTLCSEERVLLMESIEFPEPVIQVAIQPENKSDQDKISEALARIAAEDPTFRMTYNRETGQTLISGMGELHLEIVAERLTREFNLKFALGQPQVAYRETITRPAEHGYRYVKQTGGRGQFAHVVLRLEEGEGFEFVNRVTGGAIPREYIPAVEEGIKQALEEGVLKGYPVVNVRAILLDGSFHEVDSSELAFRTAATLAAKECLKKAAPRVLEPIMKLEISSPEEYTGSIINNISNRRGRLESMEQFNNTQVIRSTVPLAELFGYSTVLRSLTQGRAGFNMEFSHYEESGLAG